MKQLENESIEIIREAVAGASKPVMLYSIGKDSSVMLHLARKAFYPARPLSRCCMLILPGSFVKCTPTVNGWQQNPAWN